VSGPAGHVHPVPGGPGDGPSGLAEVPGDLPWDLLVLTALVAAGVLYAHGAQVAWHKGGVGHGVRRLEVAAFGGALVVLAVALLSPLDRLSELLFAAHMSQHELLMVVAAPLSVLGRPWVALTWAVPPAWRGPVFLAIRRWGLLEAWRTLTAPVVALVLHAAALWIWHVPRLFDAALAHADLHALQHASFFATAELFWFALLQGRYGRAGYGVAVLYVFVTATHSGVLGAALALASEAWYPLQAERAVAFGADPLVDQHARRPDHVDAGGRADAGAGAGPGRRLDGRGRAAGGPRRVHPEDRRGGPPMRTPLAAPLLVLLLAPAGCDLDAERDPEHLAIALTGGDPDRGPDAIRRYGCGSCHDIPGVPGADSLVGPPLTSFSRRTYLAGRFPNTGETLIRWIERPQEMNPGSAMPDMGVTPEDAADIAAYLYTLD
jgi:putative membrane protein